VRFRVCLVDSCCYNRFTSLCSILCCCGPLFVFVFLLISYVQTLTNCEILLVLEKDINFSNKTTLGCCSNATNDIDFAYCVYGLYGDHMIIVSEQFIVTPGTKILYYALIVGRTTKNTQYFFDFAVALPQLNQNEPHELRLERKLKSEANFAIRKHAMLNKL